MVQYSNIAMSSDYIVKPVQKALQVLLHLGRAERPLTLTELSHQLCIPKTTIFRYLQTLVASGFVAHDTTNDQYHLGLRLWELGHAASANVEVRTIALPWMRELRDQFNETVNLGVIEGKEVVYVEIVESHYSLRMHAKIGGRDPIYSTSLGKAVLAFVPERHWARHLPSRLTPRTSNTLTTMASLRQDLLRTRERGYAIDYGENEDGAYCVGAPIMPPSQSPTAAISVSAPASRLNEAARQNIVAAVLATAARISQQLAGGAL
jgi:DNA-binding IclR family transcriptional regulator